MTTAATAINEKMARKLSPVKEHDMSGKLETAKTVVNGAKAVAGIAIAVVPPVGITAAAILEVCDTCLDIIKSCEEFIHTLQGNAKSKNEAIKIFNKINEKVAILSSILSNHDLNAEDFDEEHRSHLEFALLQCEQTVKAADGNLNAVHQSLQGNQTFLRNVKDWFSGRLEKVRIKLHESYMKMKESIDNLELSLQATTSDDVRQVKKRLEEFKVSLEVWQNQCQQVWEDARKLYEENAALQRQMGVLETKLEESQYRTQAKIAEIEAKLGESEAKVGECQARLGESQAKLGESQAKLGEAKAKAAASEDKAAKFEAQAAASEDKAAKFEAQAAASEAQSKRYKKIILETLEKYPIMTVEDKSRLEMAMLLENHTIVAEIMTKYVHMSAQEQSDIINTFRWFGECAKEMVSDTTKALQNAPNKVCSYGWSVLGDLLFPDLNDFTVAMDDEELMNGHMQ